jgi:Uma2 family endonuclease
VRGEKTDFRSRHPETAELVVEIAVSSLEIDRVKAAIYAEAGVREYWIVCPEEKRVEVYRQPSALGYGEQVEVAAPAVLECGALPGVRVDLGALFA